jgi:hypothetical protein
VAPNLRDTARGTERWQFYDIAGDIFWREVTTEEIALIQADRAERGLPRLVFTEPYAAVKAYATEADTAAQAGRLRAFLGMPWDGTAHGAFGHVLKEALRRLGAGDA